MERKGEKCSPLENITNQLMTPSDENTNSSNINFQRQNSFSNSCLFDPACFVKNTVFDQNKLPPAITIETVRSDPQRKKISAVTPPSEGGHMTHNRLWLVEHDCISESNRVQGSPKRIGGAEAAIINKQFPIRLQLQASA